MGVTLALMLLFSAFVRGFAAVGNLQVIASNSAALLILSCGMGIVITAQGLDLSMVAVMAAGRRFRNPLQCPLFRAGRRRADAAGDGGARLKPSPAEEAKNPKQNVNNTSD